MPLLDVLLPLAVLPVALAALRTARRRRTLRMPVAGRLGTEAPGALLGLAVLLAATVAQFGLSGWRWQLMPVAAGSLVLLLVLGARALGRPALLAGTAAVLALAGAGTSLALSWALPLRILEAPTGPYAIGTTTFVVTDPARIEQYGPTPGGARELVVQVWYPADPTAEGRRAPLVPQASAFVDIGAVELGLPRFALGHLGRIPSNAVTDVDTLTSAAPVALLAHGWTGLRMLQTDLAEQLASMGWVVAAADHRYGALVTTFPDGRADPFDPEALPEFGTVPADEYARRSRTLVRTFAEDLALVLATLERSPPAVLDGRLDLGRIALLGHSTGGGAAIEACAAEPRCSAVVGFDPWVEPVSDDVLRTGTGRPMLSLRTEDWVARPNEDVLQGLHAAHRESRVAEGLVRIDGALHRDFTLIGALSPLGRLLGLTGGTAEADTRSATAMWTGRFLDHHVRGVGPDPLRDPPATRVGVLEVAP